jgi:hypothetical protein
MECVSIHTKTEISEMETTEISEMEMMETTETATRARIAPQTTPPSPGAPSLERINSSS